MSTIAALCPLSGTPMLDIDGAPMRGGQVFIYNAGTTTARATYKDFALTTKHPIPIKTNAYGRIPQIYVDTGDYSVVLKDPAGSLIDSYDRLPGASQGTGGAGGTSATGLATGDLKPTYTAAPQTGWLICNGNTIGSASSSGTARANDDTFNLYVALWNADPNLVVAPNRGSSATSDFSASKTITLPDLRGRFLAGVDKMGAAATAGRITSFTTTTPDQVGAAFGAEQIALSVSQLPVFTVSVSISAAGGHSHSGYTDAQGYHSHGGATLPAGSHSHNYQFINIGNGVSGASYGKVVGSYYDATSVVGDHSHSIYGDGSHGHNVTTYAVGDHSHAATASSVGNGMPHSIMSPTILCYWFIRL